jgi:hypothetical protein
VKGWKNIFQGNGAPKKAVAILLSNKAKFKPKLVRRDKEDPFIRTKEIHEEYWHTQLHTTNTTGHKSTDRCQHSKSV